MACASSHTMGRFLWVARSDKVTDKALAALKKAPVKRLGVNNCKGVTDAGVKELAGYPKLTDLEIWECKGVTDKSVPVFAEMKRLKSLKLTKCGVSKAGADDLRKDPGKFTQIQSELATPGPVLPKGFDLSALGPLGP